MRQGYEQLTDLNGKHNDVHRKAYQTPWLYNEESTYPTADTMTKGEVKVCINSSTSAICYRLQSGSVLSAGLT